MCESWNGAARSGASGAPISRNATRPSHLAPTIIQRPSGRERQHPRSREGLLAHEPAVGKAPDAEADVLAPGDDAAAVAVECYRERRARCGPADGGDGFA